MVQVLGTDSANNDGVLSEIEVYTEPLCSWFDGCSRHEVTKLCAAEEGDWCRQRFMIDEEERIKQEEIRNLTKQIKVSDRCFEYSSSYGTRRRELQKMLKSPSLKKLKPTLLEPVTSSDQFGSSHGL
eukprot:754010-Hanusia_phi.AAC.3